MKQLLTIRKGNVEIALNFQLNNCEFLKIYDALAIAADNSEATLVATIETELPKRDSISFHRLPPIGEISGTQQFFVAGIPLAPASNNKLMAIKLLRELTGLSLTESKSSLEKTGSKFTVTSSKLKNIAENQHLRSMFYRKESEDDISFVKNLFFDYGYIVMETDFSQV